MLATVDVPHCYSSKGGTEGSKAEDEHGSLISGIGLIGFTYEHWDDGTAKVLDEEYHRVGSTKAFQGDNLRHTGPESGRSHGVADAENEHQGDGDGAAVHG